LDLLPGSGGGIIPSGLNPLSPGNIAAQSAETAKKLTELKQKADAIRIMASAIEKADLPQGIPVADTKRLIDLSTKAVVDFAQVSAQAASAAPEIEDRILSSRSIVQQDYQQKITNRLVPAIKGKSDRETIRGSLVTSNVGLLLRSIAGGYETLGFFVSIRPGFLSILPSSAMKVIVDIAELVAKVAKVITEAFKEALNNVKKFTIGFMEILKWGTIAGGLYLLYEVLKEEKS
jgi:hypothetical protein